MFSQFIQGLLNTGGQTQAIQRYAQITNKVNSLNAQNNPANPLDTLYPDTNKVNNAPSFEKVLQSTTTSNFGTLLLDPRLKQVNADLIKASPQLSFSNALQEANAIQANTQSATKSQILSGWPSVTDSEVKNFLIAHISCCIFSLTESSHFLLRWIRFSENRSVHAFVRAGIRGC